jgi:MFS family permease
MILFPPARAYVAEIAPPGRRGEYMGMYSMVFGAAVTLGPWLGTAVLEAFGRSSICGPAPSPSVAFSVLILSRLRS